MTKLNQKRYDKLIMLPLYDQFRVSKKTPWLTIFLIGLNVFLFLFSLQNLNYFITNFGLVPVRVFQGEALFGLATSMFFHAGLWHLLGNMWFLWVFGANLERKLGKLKFLIFYLLCGVFSAIIYLILASQKTIPAIGASGAVSGILGGYLILFPRHKIVSIVPIFFFLQIVAVPALIFIGLWFLYQLLYIGTQTMIAYWAHIAGFLTGILLIKLFIKNYSYIGK
ncbi:MAG: rhomboid family intramembrane serine protease [Patescibacteria group bacterium]|nr:rhomboid family intramembrane serine protease [Patescibacteria group bacterium]